MKVVPLNADLFMDTYNLSYDELQKNIVQACKKNFLDDLALPTFIRERVIMVDTRKNPNSIVTSNFAFTSATNLNTEYLMAKNKKLEMKLHISKQEVEQLCTTT